MPLSCPRIGGAQIFGNARESSSSRLKTYSQFTDDVEANIQVEAKDEQCERQQLLPSIELRLVEALLIVLSDNEEERPETNKFT